MELKHKGKPIHLWCGGASGWRLGITRGSCGSCDGSGSSDRCRRVRLKFTNNHNIPRPFELFRDSETHTRGGADYSVTGLIDSPQIAHLTSLHEDEMSVDIADELLSILGTAVHKVFEIGKTEDSLIEERLHCRQDGVSVSGQIDRMININHGTDDQDLWTLQDLKVTSAKALINNKNPKIEWVQQINLYALLMKANGYELSGEAEIIAVVRDFSKYAGLRTDGYPEAPVVRIPIPLWSHVERVDYLSERIALHKDAANYRCTKKDRWESDSRWAVTKYTAQGALAKRATRVLDSQTEAMDYIIDNGIQAEIIERPGKAIRCEDGWCPVAKWCPQWKKEQGERW